MKKMLFMAVLAVGFGFINVPTASAAWFSWSDFTDRLTQPFVAPKYDLVPKPSVVPDKTKEIVPSVLDTMTEPTVVKMEPITDCREYFARPTAFKTVGAGLPLLQRWLGQPVTARYDDATVAGLARLICGDQPTKVDATN